MINISDEQIRKTARSITDAVKSGVMGLAKNLHEKQERDKALKAEIDKAVAEATKKEEIRQAVLAAKRGVKEKYKKKANMPDMLGAFTMPSFKAPIIKHPKFEV